LVKRIREGSRPVGDVFDVRNGLQAYERGKGTPRQTAEDVKNHVFDRTERQDDDSYRYLQGADVARYRLAWSGSWLQYGPWLSQPRSIDIFTRPRVLVREITSRLPYCLHAGFVSEVYLNNKSILNVLHEEDDVDELKCLAAVLNSRAASFFYKATAVKSARTLFPKVLTNNLREFPYPNEISPEARAEMVRRVDRASELTDLISRASTPRQAELHEREAAANGRKLDQLVARALGLSTAEAEQLRGLTDADE
jgi:hypothetical protein